MSTGRATKPKGGKPGKSLSKVSDSNKTVSRKPKPKQARCLAIAKKGIGTADDFAQFMSMLMSDIVEGAITPEISYAVVNAAASCSSLWK